MNPGKSIIKCNPYDGGLNQSSRVFVMSNKFGFIFNKSIHSRRSAKENVINSDLLFTHGTY